MWFKHSKSIAQQLIPIYNTTVHKNEELCSPLCDWLCHNLTTPTGHVGRWTGEVLTIFEPGNFRTASEWSHHCATPFKHPTGHKSGTKWNKFRFQNWSYKVSDFTSWYQSTPCCAQIWYPRWEIDRQGYLKSYFVSIKFYIKLHKKLALTGKKRVEGIMVMCQQLP